MPRHLDLATQTVASWNQLIGWLREVEQLRQAQSTFAA